ncbi:uncharacterized protein TRAVEDRAFT_44227 [Trametes versicolor FP-101664 SS1]|uniref:uncharacterized protein n=1 Tax=Trametes versicolor (strain FP-101664) TaxID=717944 RepID=UPI0004622C99|nr:uncharacterized protein TRAVEDRAFT_44227 [Trametes versicolor FP-101664 SS1]EIW62407.1 hypothetical protein TRAVEDRAFT_44227 [Trametes versicolor FP-101664 SS1]
MLHLLRALFFLVFLGSANAAAPTRCDVSQAQLPKPSDFPIIDTLPDPFTFRLSNRRVSSRADWECRREELMMLVQQYLYGFYPDHSRERVVARRSRDNLTINVFVDGKSASFPAILTFPPRNATHAGRVPVMINPGSIDNGPFLDSGVALATFDVSTVAVDSTARTGAFWTLYDDRDIGTLTAWAWAHHRILDAIEQVAPEVDTARVGVIGCSRFGKSALAAGIFDKRIKLSLPLSSGAEGIGPWRYYYESQGAAERINNIFGGFPYWSNTVLGEFVNIPGNSSRLPFDAHELVSLIAPRAVLWDEGQEDWWINPEGSISVTHGGAKVVFDWLGAGENIGVHVRHPPDDGHCGDTGYSVVQPFVRKVFFGTPTQVNFSDISPFPAHPEAYPWATATPKVHL